MDEEKRWNPFTRMRLNRRNQCRVMYAATGWRWNWYHLYRSNALLENEMSVYGKAFDWWGWTFGLKSICSKYIFRDMKTDLYINFTLLVKFHNDKYKTIECISYLYYIIYTNISNLLFADDNNVYRYISVNSEELQE